MTDLLALARRRLDDGGEHAHRIAAWFARSALEDAVQTRLDAKGLDPGPRAASSTMLICLESLYRAEDPALARDAAFAWERLSAACHQHAFELSPSYAEVARLITLVARIAGRAESAP